MGAEDMAQYAMQNGRMVPITDNTKIDQIRQSVRDAQLVRVQQHNQERQASK